MTEFEVGPSLVLGLMPESGIRRLLGAALPDPAAGGRPPRAEFYLIVDDPHACLERAARAGARVMSSVEPRDWGDRVGYCLDPDGHVIAFAARGTSGPPGQAGSDGL